MNHFKMEIRIGPSGFVDGGVQVEVMFFGHRHLVLECRPDDVPSTLAHVLALPEGIRLLRQASVHDGKVST